MPETVTVERRDVVVRAGAKRSHETAAATRQPGTEMKEGCLVQVGNGITGSS